MKPFFLAEHAILQEATIIKQKPNRCIFRMVIQTADEGNQNKRIYPHDVLNEAIQNCRGMMKARNFYGELDHPIPSDDQSYNEIRQTTVLLKEASHIIRDYQWDGGRLIGEFETLTTPNGQIALSLVLDKTTIGTSMRGIADLKYGNDGFKYVKSPLTIIGYDLVSRPSHKVAVIDERLVTFESLNLLQESHRTQTICTPDGICYLSNHFDKLVEQKLIKFRTNWV